MGKYTEYGDPKLVSECCHDDSLWSGTKRMQQKLLFCYCVTFYCSENGTVFVRIFMCIIEVAKIRSDRICKIMYKMRRLFFVWHLS